MNETAMWRIWPPLFLAFVLQTTLLAHIEFFGARFDLPLLVVIAVALLLGWRVGAVCGLVAGLVTGFLVAKNPGSWAWSFLTAGGLLGWATGDNVRDNVFAPPLLAALGTLLVDATLLLMSPTDFSFAWWLHHTPLRMAMHAVLVWPLYFALRRWLRPPSKLLFS